MRKYTNFISNGAVEVEFNLLDGVEVLNTMVLALYRYRTYLQCRSSFSSNRFYLTEPDLVRMFLILHRMAASERHVMMDDEEKSIHLPDGQANMWCRMLAVAAFSSSISIPASSSASQHHHQHPSIIISIISWCIIMRKQGCQGMAWGIHGKVCIKHGVLLPTCARVFLRHWWM